MMAVAFELSTSIHDDECSCLTTKTWATFEAAVRRQHPAAWQWATEWKGLVTNDTTYIDARNEFGVNPKRQSNPDAVPVSRQRRLTRAERLEDLRHKRRWRFADRPIYDDSDSSLLVSFANGGPMSPSQAALLSVIAEGWLRCSRPSRDAKGNPREGVYHEAPPEYVREVDGEPVCDSCHAQDLTKVASSP